MWNTTQIKKWNESMSLYVSKWLVIQLKIYIEFVGENLSLIIIKYTFEKRRWTLSMSNLQKMNIVMICGCEAQNKSTKLREILSKIVARCRAVQMYNSMVIGI